MIKFSPNKWLADVSIARKLYFVVFTMLILITFELLCLWFSINTLSSVRAYVGGEGLWAKAQKDASYSLRKYALTHDQNDYLDFLTFLKVPLGDKKARLELDKPEPDYPIITQGFIEGRNNPEDIQGLTDLYRRFHKISYMAKAISIWSEADTEISRLQKAGLKLHKMISSQKVSDIDINKTLTEIDLINNKLTRLEDDFSYTLGEASRWMANLLLNALLLVALSIEISVLMLTVFFTRRISKGIEEINIAAIKVSNGNFDAKVPVNSFDEIGNLAVTFNKMTDSLEQNILERKKSEQSLRENEELFKGAFNNAPIGISLVSLEGRFLRVNRSLSKILGYSESELLEKTFSEITYPEDLEISEDVVKYLNSNDKTSVSIEKRYLNKAGNIIWVRINTSLHRSIEGKPLYFITHTEEITEHKKSAIKLYEQAALLDKAQDAIIVRDLDYNIIYWNKSAELLYGWTGPEALNKKITDLIVEKTNELHEAQESLMKKGEWTGELRQITKSGTKIIVQSRWTLIHDKTDQPISILVVNTDITEKKALEEQFYRSQRLESIGTLTAGIAHDLNNILTPIMVSADLLRMDLPENKRNRILNILEETAQRGSDIIKQLLIFGRGVEGKKVNLELGSLITDMGTIIRETFPKSITIKKDVPESLWLVPGDSTQLQQVLLNLFVNARDAMPNGGVLKIASENIFIDENFIHMNPEAVKGPYVSLEITDTGTGIAPEIIGKIFEPFFTTKEAGTGSGLGLSIIIGIIKSHKGFVNVYSQLGQGTQFKIFLPAANSDSQTEILKTRHLNPTNGNGELIMVVDDESAILEIVKSILEKFNYKVITADNGLEAMEIYKTRKEEIKVILTDINMPFMDGFTLIKSISEINPDSLVIASSGLLMSINKPDIAALNIKSFLQKPYTSEDLLNKISEVLN